MPPKRVLIADDTEFFRAALKDILSRAGYEVVGEASNGAEAIELARTLRPDLVLLDVVMPIKNGIEAAKSISALKLPIKIVMCTSLGYEPIVAEAVKAGASGYIMKPPSEAKVLAALNAL